MPERRYRKVPGTVWCGHHGCVHVKHPDPYNEGTNCRWAHEPVYRLTDEEE